MTKGMSIRNINQGPAIFSYGFRPFFLGGALFAGIAVPVWIGILMGWSDLILVYAPREWHVHEMVFGFLSAIVTGFLLTAMPNWTGRPPIRGIPLMLLFMLWVAGRIGISVPLVPHLISALIDGAFLVVMAGIVWRELIGGKIWDRVPIGILISLYAVANMIFHVLALDRRNTDLGERMALGLIMLLLVLIGGRITPSFTSDYLEQETGTQPLSFSSIDYLSIVFGVIAAIAWTVQPQSRGTGWVFLAVGSVNLFRMVRWYGWLTWREPLVLILHVGYAWLVMSLLVIGGVILGLGMPRQAAIHVLTTGAVGSMTLAVMTRASLGHTGRSKHAGPWTLLMYFLVNLGALLRIFGPVSGPSTLLMLGVAAMSWSGAYLLFAVIYGRILLSPSLDDE